jgi:alpha-L-fucosidase
MHHSGFRDTGKPARKNWEGQYERPEWSTYLDYMEDHLRHLLTAYGQIDLLWFDGLAEQNKYKPERFHRVIRELAPDIIINDRLADLGDYVTPEQGVPDGVPVVRSGERAELRAVVLKRLLRVLVLPGMRHALK